MVLLTKISILNDTVIHFMQENPNRKKLVAFVSNSAWSVYNFRLDVLEHLLQQHYDVLVIAPDDEFSALLKEKGCHFLPINFNNRAENPLQDLRLYRQLKKIYKQYQPDLIFHYVIKPNIFGSLAAASVSKRSIAVITGLGYTFARKNWLYRIVKALYRRALTRVEEVWFLNNEDARVFAAEKIVEIDKMKVLPGEGINTCYFSPEDEPERPPGNFTFLMSTRLLKSKGVGLYADAARILKRKGYKFNFELLGFYEKNHPDSISVEDMNKWKRDGIICYRGFAKDVRPFLQKADCFVFPSFYNEGVPRCLMEAASMELPIITAFNRGCKEVVLNNSNGYVCNSQDPFDLADKMEKMYLLSAEERRRMGKNGRSLVVKKFGINKVIAEYDQVLKKL